MKVAVALNRSEAPCSRSQILLFAFQYRRSLRGYEQLNDKVSGPLRQHGHARMKVAIHSHQDLCGWIFGLNDGDHRINENFEIPETRLNASIHMSHVVLNELYKKDMSKEDPFELHLHSQKTYLLHILLSFPPSSCSTIDFGFESSGRRPWASHERMD